MKILVVMNGSEYGQWALTWLAPLAWVEPPRVAARHVMDILSLRVPFVVQPAVLGGFGL